MTFSGFNYKFIFQRGRPSSKEFAKFEKNLTKTFVFFCGCSLNH